MASKYSGVTTEAENLNTVHTTSFNFHVYALVLAINKLRLSESVNGRVKSHAKTCPVCLIEAVLRIDIKNISIFKLHNSG